MARVVFDTNVLVSSLIRAGKPRNLTKSPFRELIVS